MKWFLQNILQGIMKKDINWQMLYQWVIRPSNPATQWIVFKIVGFWIGTMFYVTWLPGSLEKEQCLNRKDHKLSAFGLELADLFSRIGKPFVMINQDNYCNKILFLTFPAMFLNPVLGISKFLQILGLQPRISFFFLHH